MSEKTENKPQNFADTLLNAIGQSSKSWYFTFIAWWVVFNYDFLLITFGKLQYLNEINQYYCGIPRQMFTTDHLSITGCTNPTHWLYEFYHTPIISKFLLPIGMTVLSLLFFEKWIHNILDRMEAKRHRYIVSRLNRYLLKQKHKVLIDEIQDLQIRNERLTELLIRERRKSEKTKH